MREILFRGKRISDGSWVCGGINKVFHPNFDCENGCAFFMQIPNCYCICADGKDFFVEQASIGQFTGLTDKNSKRVFEGDIVRYGDTVHKVVFEQRNGTAYFGLVYSSLETLPFGHYQDLKQIEVIGNIHDNPELLKGGE